MRGRQLSYRRRRHLVALICLAVVAGGVAAAITFLPRGEKPDRGRTSLPPLAGQAGSRPTPHVTHLSATERERLRSSILLFVGTSVARRHPERSWPIIHPTLREGLTMRQWMTGNIPVVPYPAVGVDLLRLQSVVNQTALVEVMLEPAPRSHLVRKTFQIELRRLPRPPHRWAVSSWVPEGVSESQILLNARRSPSVVAATDHARHFSALWIFVPIGLLVGGLILVPTGLFVREAYQFRRAKAEFRASLDDRAELRR
jgi:hypothetical protein